jgi:CRISPR-associated protein Csh1
MLRAIRTLTLDYIFEKLGDKNNPRINLDKWYRDLRVTCPDKLLPFLVESIDNIEKIYILQADIDKYTVKLSVEDMTKEKALRLPFKQYRARAIGPVMKRSNNKDEVSPSLTTQNATLEYFKKVGKSSAPWAGYFREISEIIDRPKLKLTDNSIIETGKNKKWLNTYSAALDLIPTTKGTVMVTIADKDGRWPGDRLEYRNYLINDLPKIKYCTSKVSFIEGKTCPLCGTSGVNIFPNALRGAGINLTNFDRVGVFNNINEMEAWKRYGLCSACADLLYIYKFHVLKKDLKKRNPFITHIAGDTAIVIPFTTLDYSVRRSIWRKVSDFVKNASSDVEEDEASLLDILKDEKGILNLTFLWATVGQEISDVTGMITNVPRSRLTEISKFNYESREWRNLLFPETFLRIKESNFIPDLSLRALRTLFYRPGGKKSKNANESMKLQQLKKSIATSIYHKTKIPLSRFWDEIMITARGYWLEAIEKGSVYNLLYEGKKKTGESYITAAGWIRHLSWWIYYFKRLEVMKMEDNFYEPKIDQLKPFFGPESGINSSEKAYIFLLGVLYGKVLQVQYARGINVGANALSWLKRLTLKGSDIPGLYIKIRQKLLAYEIEKSSQVRDLITEIGRLGCLLGDKIELDETSTNYYLLLGQSLTMTILPKKDDSKD